MVEGGIVAPVFVLMFIFNVYLGGVYQAKYKSFMKSRFSTWSYASQNCTGGDGNASKEQNQDGFQSPPEAGQGAGGQVPGASDATASFFMAHGQDKEHFMYLGNRITNNSQDKWVHTESWVMCNEEPHGHNIFTYLGSNIMSLIKSAF